MTTTIIIDPNNNNNIDDDDDARRGWRQWVTTMPASTRRRADYECDDAVITEEDIAFAIGCPVLVTMKDGEDVDSSEMG